MNTSELIQNFTKGGTVCKLSPKQRDWLISVAKREGLYITKGHNDHIVMPDKKIWVINTCHRLASGGSYVGSRPTGNFGLRLHYHIKFQDTGITQFMNSEEHDRLLREQYKFDLI